jgi:tetratricopeptide (TPR) repeat protein
MSKSTRKIRKPVQKAQTRVADAASSRPFPSANSVCFLVIFASAFLLRLLYLAEIESIPLFYHLAGDGRIYDEWGQRIAAGDWLGKGVFYQAPLYPYFFGLLQIFFGHDLWLIRLVQIGLGAVSCALIFLVGMRLFSRPAGIASGVILSLYAPAIFFDGLIEKSILDLALLSLLLLLLTQSMDGKSRGIQWLALGGVLGLLGLSRENALILVAIVAIWIVFYFAAATPETRLRRIALFFAGVLLVLVPVGLRNLGVGGEFKLTTSQFGTNFFIGNNPSADGTYDSITNVIGEPQLEGPDATRLAQRAVGRTLTPGEVSDYWFGRSIQYIRSQPGHWVQLLAKKWLMVWNEREVEDSDDFYIYQGWSWLLWGLSRISNFGVLAPLAVLGAVVTLNRWRELWLLHSIVVSLALSVTAFYVFGRYRYPLVPLLVLFAGAAIAKLIECYKMENWRALLIAAGILVVTSVIVNWPIYGIRGPWPGGYNNLSNAYYKQGKVKEATENALKAVQLQPDFGVAHFNLGNLYAYQRKHELSRHHFEQAIRIFPNYAEARSNLGQLLAEQGDLKGGIEHFRKAIELNPSVSRSHLNLGVALAKLGQLEEAIQSLQQTIQLVPNHAPAHYYLGSVYAALGQYDQATLAFRTALQIQGNSAATHHSLARVLSLQGKKEEAVAHYREAVRLDRAAVRKGEQKTPAAKVP